MNIIIAYASAGAGHFKAAEAVYNHLKPDKNLNLKLIDVLDQSNPFFSNFYRSGYDFIVKHFPSFWAVCFYVTHTRALRPIAQRMRLAINRTNTKDFSRFLIDVNPDYILSTHFLSSEIAAYLKRKNKIQSRLFTVITDFGVHSFWVAQGTDRYFVACDFTKAQLIKEGVSPEGIHTAGIPIDSKFTRPLSKQVICAKLGLDEKRFTALVMTGSFGIGPLEKIVDLLHPDIQILVVCAKNERLHSRLKNKNYPSVKIFAFVDNTEELMAVADVIITKAGGLTISEFLAREVVPVFICAIPGQEKTNIRVLASYGIGREAKTVQQIKRTVLDYKEHPEQLAKIKQKIRDLKKPFAVEELSHAICQSGSGAAGRGAL
jgi:processive 1,2-diacylglycerol beta-glucosyltransferase